MMKLPLAGALASSLLLTGLAQAQETKPDESLLGELVITGASAEHVTRLAILPSLSPDIEDVTVRSVVRRDMELSGMFRVISDTKAPAGLYGFNDEVDVDAWKKLGAEVIVKVAARKRKGKVEVLGLAYFSNVGKDPVYEKKLVVTKGEVRETAHRITDALLGAITGRPGGFASHLTYSGKWGSARRVFTLDADGHDLTPVTPDDQVAIAPSWRADKPELYYTFSKNYRPFKLFRFADDKHEMVKLPFKGSIYSVAFDQKGERMAIAVAEDSKTQIYVGKADGSDLKKVSTTELATHPVFSPSGKLAWVGGGYGKGSLRRIYVDGKAVSPPGFTASAPEFCDTEDGIRLVYSVNVGSDNRDIVMSWENGKGIMRLTQNQGSNTYPACSPDGRMLAFFSTRKKQKGTYVMNLKRWKTMKLNTRHGESLRWAPLPPPAHDFKNTAKKPSKKKAAEPKAEAAEE